PPPATDPDSVPSDEPWSSKMADEPVSQHIKFTPHRVPALMHKIHHPAGLSCFSDVRDRTSVHEFTSNTCA
ncbi:1572_t:CDS:2, partial [Acaulospora colombiana]